MKTFAALLFAALICAPAPATADEPIRVVIPAIEMNREVVLGGQAELDAGNVVLIAATDIETLCRPSQQAANKCFIVWVGAHRTSHGASGIRIPELVIGSRITMWESEVMYDYEVTEIAIVPNDTRLNRMPQANNADLAFQVSWTGGNRYFVFANRTLSHAERIR